MSGTFKTNKFYPFKHIEAASDQNFLPVNSDFVKERTVRFDDYYRFTFDLNTIKLLVPISDCSKNYRTESMDEEIFSSFKDEARLLYKELSEVTTSSAQHIHIVISFSCAEDFWGKIKPRVGVNILQQDLVSATLPLVSTFLTRFLLPFSITRLTTRLDSV